MFVPWGASRRRSFWIRVGMSHHLRWYLFRSQIARAFIVEEQHEQHEDRRGRQELELLLRPGVQLKIWIGSTVNGASRPLGVEGDEHERADQHRAARPRRSRATAPGSSRSRCRGRRPAAPGARSSASASRRARARPRGSSRGTARIASREAMITIGSTSSDSVSAPASTRRPRPDGPRTKNARPEDAVDDRRDRGEVLDVQLDQRGCTSARGRRTPRGRARRRRRSGS